MPTSYILSLRKPKTAPTLIPDCTSGSKRFRNASNNRSGFSFVFTFLQQIQNCRHQNSGQVMYWLPITWQEHTPGIHIVQSFRVTQLARVGFASGIIVYAAFTGLVLWRFNHSAFRSGFPGKLHHRNSKDRAGAFHWRGLQVSGRAAIWVRFIVPLVFFIVFYIFYFYITSGFGSFIDGVTKLQKDAWFVPFVWIALAVYYLMKGVFLNGALL